MAKPKETIFEWTDNQNNKHQFSIEQIESVIYKNKDSLSYKLAQSSSVLKSIFNFLGVKTTLEKETNMSVIKQKLEKNNINLNAVDSSQQTPLLYCMNNQATLNIQVIEMLIQYNNIDVNKQDKDGKTALHIAIEKGNRSISELLLKQDRIDINKADNNGKTALHWAATSGNPEIVELLIKQGADVNKADKDGKTALHYAAEKTQDYEIVKSLVGAQGADVNTQDKYGKTALHYAAERKKTSKDSSVESDIVERLVSAQGADVNTQDNYGKTALHYAVGNHDSFGVVDDLLSAKSNRYIKDKDGKTALHYAAQSDEYTIKRLSKHNKSLLGIKDKDDKTAFDYAWSEKAKNLLNPHPKDTPAKSQHRNLVLSTSSKSQTKAEREVAKKSETQRQR
jgi:ankyrin repeat protein